MVNEKKSDSVDTIGINELMVSKRFALVGAGQLGAMAIELWPETVPKPEFYLDSIKTGELKGIKILDLKTHVPVKGITYLSCFFKVDVKEIKMVFREKLHQSILLTVYDFLQHYSPKVFSNGWYNYDNSKSRQGEISTVRSVLADENSVNAFDAVCSWRYKRRLVDNYPVGMEDDKYNLGLFGRSGFHYDLVYDCGCYDLSFLSYLKKATVSFAKYIAFEPDPKRFDACLIESQKHDDEIIIEKEALYDQVGPGIFLANGLLSARLVDDAVVSEEVLRVNRITLDSYHDSRSQLKPASHNKVLIKMHIEGAEPAAIKGALKLIASTQSDLYINISHDEPSLLEVPVIISELGKHDIFMRSHALFGEGLTLFARYK
jgi:FkbM family methyltransferase